MMLALFMALQVAQPGAVPVERLIGLSPEAVAEALGAPAPTGIEPLLIVENGRQVAIYPGDAFRAPAPAGQQCATQLLTPADAADLTDRDIGRLALSFRARFLFENGRLIAVDEPPMRQTPAAPPRESRGAMMERYQQAGAVTNWTVAPGRLPLSEGAAVVDRMKGPADATAAVTTLCRDRPVSPPAGERPFDDAGFLQGLALLPFAWMLPGLNAERERDAVNGPALLASVQPGDVLPNGAEAFVGGRPRVRLYRDDADPAYGVIVVSVGNPDRNNLGRTFDVGMIGVRGDRVVWTASPQMVELLGLKTPMCIGADGRLDRERRGCSTTGYFTFGD